MRTTVTLDPDVAAGLEAVARDAQALGSAVRIGLGAPRHARRAFAQYARPMGLRPGRSLSLTPRGRGCWRDAQRPRPSVGLGPGSDPVER